MCSTREKNLQMYLLLENENITLDFIHLQWMFILLFLRLQYYHIIFTIPFILLKSSHIPLMLSFKLIFSF